MRIAIINGSPKGEDSVTLQHCLYLEKKNRDKIFTFHHVGQRIKKLDKDPDAFGETLRQLQEADALIWIFPVYTLIVPAQLHRFIELLYERAPFSLKGKYATTFSTSMHFFDNTAHDYMYRIFKDFGLICIPGFSANSDDFLLEDKRKEFLAFGNMFFTAVNKKLPGDNHHPETNPDNMRKNGFSYQAPEAPEVARTETGKRIIVLTDYEEPEGNLNKMLRVFLQHIQGEVEIHNIREDLKLKGGCLGCMDCFVTETCVYKDNFSDFHQESVLTADAVVMALEIKYHSFSSAFKIYQDRLFYNGHRANHAGIPVAYILSGSLSHEPNLLQVITGTVETGKQFLAGIVTDEAGNSEEITRDLEGLAFKLEYALEHKLSRPLTFPGIGGSKIFRDMIYSMKGLNPKDHHFYKRNKLYDFPQKQLKKRMQGFIVGILFKLMKQSRKKKIDFRKLILMPYRKILDSEK